MPRLTQELQFPNQDTNPKAPYNGVAVFCKNGSLYTIDTNGIVALIGSGNSEPVDLSNYYTISETDNAISTAINALINGAPGTLDTLKELADAVNSNKSLVDALNEAISNKQDKLVSGTNIKTINGNSLTGSGNITVNELKGFVSYDDERLGTADYSYFAIKPRELPTYNKEKYEAHIGPLNDVSFIQGKLINMSSGTEFDQNYTKEAGNNYWILDIPKKSGTLATLEDIQSSGGSGIDDSTISTSSTYSSSKIDSTYLKAPEGRLDIENGRVNLKNNINSVYSITNNEVVMELNDDGLRYHDNATNLDVNITPYYGAIDQNVDPATIKVNGIGLARETDLNKKVSLRGDTMTGNLNAPAFTVDSTKVAAGDKPLIDGAINFKYKNTNDEPSNAWLSMLPSGQLQFGSQGSVASEIGTVATQEWVNKKITNAYIYKGSVDTYDALPSGADPGFVYNVRSNGANYAWTGTEWDELGATVNLDAYALKTDLNGKQDTLVSGTNIKTINGTSILGTGDITISGGTDNAIPLTGSSSLSGNFSPSDDVGASLGSLNKRFDYIYIKTLGALFKYVENAYIDNIYLKTNIKPSKKGSVYLGTNENWFRGLYLGSPDSTGAGKLLPPGKDMRGGRIWQLPDADGTIALKTDLNGKQDKLVSGANIKTINGTSILGNGDITISGGSGSGIQIYEQMPAPEEVTDGQIIAMPSSSDVYVVYNANASSYSNGTSMPSGDTKTYNSTVVAKNYWMITYTNRGYYTNTLIVPCTGNDFYGFHYNSTSAYLRCNASVDGKSITLYNTGETIYIHAVMAF